MGFFPLLLPTLWKVKLTVHIYQAYSFRACIASSYSSSRQLHRGPWKMSLYLAQLLFSTWTQFSHVPVWINGSLWFSISLESACGFPWKISVGLLVPGKRKYNAPMTSINLLLSCQFSAKKVKLCAETHGVVRVSVTQVCFRERQESQEEIKSWWKGTLATLRLCTWPFFFFFFAAALLLSSGRETSACK